MKTLQLIVALLLPVMDLAAAKPDFAFPKQVGKQAGRELSDALKRSDGPATVRALMDFGLAQSIINSDNLPATLDKIADTGRRPDVAPATQAMLDLLQAEIYSQVYNGSRWIIDERTADGDSLALWSSRQFADTIAALCSGALNRAAELKTIPVGDWKSVVTADEALYPTLMDFAASKVIELTDGTNRDRRALPARLLCPADEFITTDFNYATPADRTVLGLYAGMLAFHAGEERAFVNWDLHRLQFLGERIHSDTSATIYDLQCDLYRRHHFAFILPWIHNSGGTYTPGRRRWLYEAALEWPGDKDMVSLAKILSRPDISARFMPVSPLDSTLTVDIHSDNANRGTLTVYRLPDSYNTGKSLRDIPDSSITKVRSISLSFTGEGVFEADTTISVRLGTYGNYLIVPELPGYAVKPSRCSTENVVTVTDIVLMMDKYGMERNRVFAVSPVNGAPLEGVTLTTKDNRTTAVRGADRFTRSIYNYNHNYTPADTWTAIAGLFTDLAIYHPGDSLTCVAVVYETNSKTRERRLAKDRKVTFTLRTPNNQEADTISAVTDATGRAVVRMALPADGLTGTYRVVLSSGSNGWISDKRVMVSDYRQPTYEVKATAAVDADGSVTVSGSAMSFAGFPIADAAVTLDLSAATFSWRFISREQTFYSTTATTDADGRFSVTLPEALLAMSPIPGGMYSATVTVTSPAGESAETAATFTTGHPYHISWDGNYDLDISGAGFTLPVKVYNTAGETVDIPLTFGLRRDSVTVATGSGIDWPKIPSAIYDIVITANDSTLAAPVTIGNVALYRPNDSIPARDDVVWIPVTRMSADASSTAGVLFGCSRPDAHILCTVWNSDTILSQQWLAPGTGMHSAPAVMPDAAGEVTVTMAAYYRGEYFQTQATITVADRPSALNIEVESMRDRITPGDSEEWTFRVTDNLGTPVRAAVMLDMYARALDLLTPQTWQMNFLRPGADRYDITRPPYYGPSLVSADYRSQSFSYKFTPLPGFDTYGRRFADGQTIRSRGGKTLYMATMKSASADTANSDIMVEEIVDCVQEVAVEEADTGSGAVATSEEKTAESPITSDEQLRTGMPLALFEPMLASDADGNLSLKFTAPNANTTWRLRLTAYTDGLLSGSSVHDIISSKPVMVQPNLPRFMRTGDTATLRASVMNNTDSTAVVTTTVEIFNPGTGTVLSTASQTDTLAAKAATVATIEVTAAADATMLGYRVRSRSGRFTDGEQKAIPVLTSAMQVLDTYPFYIQPDSANYRISIPTGGRDVTTTLQFTENAVWTCVTALPGLRADNSLSAPSATAALFSCAVADGLLRRYPQIGRALYQWQGDSMLISNLERNEELKIALLNATPWIADAASDTERMARLSLLFDRHETDAARSSAIGRLAKLVSQGGLKWTEQSDRPSLWTTLDFLESMGRLNTLGFLPKDSRLQKIIQEAWVWTDREIARDYVDSPESDYSRYVAVRDMFPGLATTAGSRKITSATVQRLVGGWRDLSPAGKARAATILNTHGYTSSARKVLESLSESEAWKKPAAATPVLDAFAAVNPSAPETDIIRQYLLLQKQAQNWGTSSSTSATIASILSTGTQWLDAADGAAIRINGSELARPDTERWTGSFTTVLPPTSGNTDIQIDKGRFPAWGAVYSRATVEADSVGPHRCDDLAVDKRILVARDGEWIEADTLAVGDKARVVLTIVAGRTMDYVTLSDHRAACLEPVEQLPRPTFSQGICFYRENRDTRTNIYIDRLPKGSYVLSADFYVTATGRFASGIAEAQSLYAPELSAHSGGTRLTVR